MTLFRARRHGLGEWRQLLLATPLLVLAAGLWLSYVSPEAQLQAARLPDGRVTVTAVRIGSNIDIAGVEVGMIIIGAQPTLDSALDNTWREISVDPGNGAAVLHFRQIANDLLPEFILLVLLLLSWQMVLGRRSEVSWWTAIVSLLVLRPSLLPLLPTYLYVPVWVLPLVLAVAYASEPARCTSRILPKVGVVAIIIDLMLGLEMWLSPHGSGLTLMYIGLPLTVVFTIIGIFGWLQLMVLPQRRRLAAQARDAGPAMSLLSSLFPTAEDAWIMATEEERDRLAGEIHDAVLPALARLTTATRKLRNSQLEEDLATVQSSLREMMNERRPVLLESFGLVAALEWLAEQTEEQTALTVELSFNGNVDQRLGSDIEQVVFRIAQQAVLNAVQHAGATLLKIDYRIDEQQGTLRVLDNGAGFDQEQILQAQRRGHRGLADMKRRAGLLPSGTLTTGNKTGGGAEVILTWKT